MASIPRAGRLASPWKCRSCTNCQLRRPERNGQCTWSSLATALKLGGKPHRRELHAPWKRDERVFLFIFTESDWAPGHSQTPSPLGPSAPAQSAVFPLLCLHKSPSGDSAGKLHRWCLCPHSPRYNIYIYIYITHVCVCLCLWVSSWILRWLSQKKF